MTDRIFKPLALSRTAPDTLEIAILDEIGVYGTSAKDLYAQIASAGSAKNIMIRMASPGGAAMEGLTMFNMLNRVKASGVNVSAQIEGLVASAATVVLMACDNVSMPETGQFMIHDPWGVMTGSSADFRAAADLMDMIKGQMIGIYQSKATNLSDEVLDKLLSDETWMTASQALEYGFIDRVDQTKATLSNTNMTAVMSSAKVASVFASAVKKISDSTGEKPRFRIDSMRNEMPPEQIVVTETAVTPVVEDPSAEKQVGKPAPSDVEVVEKPVVVADPEADALALLNEKLEPAAVAPVEEVSVVEAAPVATGGVLNAARVAEICASAGHPDQLVPMLHSGLSMDAIQSRLQLRSQMSKDLNFLRNGFINGPISAEDEAVVLNSATPEAGVKALFDLTVKNSPKIDPTPAVREEPKATVNKIDMDAVYKNFGYSKS